MFPVDPITVSDYTKAREFWTSVFKTVGYSPQHEFEGYQTFGPKEDCPNFSIAELRSPGPSPKQHLKFEWDDEKLVRDFYKKAVEAGATALKTPGLVSEYEVILGRFLDLDGNMVDVFCEASQLA